MYYSSVFSANQLAPLVATHHLSSDAVACSVLYSEVHFTTQCTGWWTTVGHGPPTDGQSPSLNQTRRCPSVVTPKKLLFSTTKNEEEKKKKEKKCYPLSFPILGGRDSTRALQPSPFQISGGVVRAWRTENKGRTNEWTKLSLLSNFRSKISPSKLLWERFLSSL